MTPASLSAPEAREDVAIKRNRPLGAAERSEAIITADPCRRVLRQTLVAEVDHVEGEQPVLHDAAGLPA